MSNQQIVQNDEKISDTNLEVRDEGMNRDANCPKVRIRPSQSNDVSVKAKDGYLWIKLPQGAIS